VTTGLGETIPLLNGVTSLTNEASSLNSTAASINSLVTSGTHTVSQIESKGIGVRHIVKLTHTQLPSNFACYMLLCSSSITRACLPCAVNTKQDWHACMMQGQSLHVTETNTLSCCRTLRKSRTSMSTRPRWGGTPGGPL